SGGRPLPLPRYQEGGDAPAGQPIIVGERGPEVIVPKGDVSVIPDIDSLLYQMGSGPAPPSRATFASAMDPYERAAYTTRRKYGTEVPGPPDLATPEEQAKAALMLAPGANIARAASLAPKTITALLAALGLSTSATEAGE